LHYLISHYVFFYTHICLRSCARAHTHP
jgi:hypothetical protein